MENNKQKTNAPAAQEPNTNSDFNPELMSETTQESMPESMSGIWSPEGIPGEKTEEKLKFKFTIPERKRAMKRLQKFKYIMDDADYLLLKKVKRHGTTDTYKHSVRVAMIAAAMAERVGEDPDSAMRAGLLHDYCHLDYNLKGEEKKKAKAEANAGLYCYYHPQNAAENAKRFGLSDRELDAIRTHMFPLGPVPKSKLGWIIRMADMEAGTEETMLAKRNSNKEKK